MAAWLVVACADHVARGKEGGFVQACHGKATPLQRMAPGDWVICYSPSQAFRCQDGLRSFTAFGRITEGEPYRFDMGGGFVPWRRNVSWMGVTPQPLEALANRLDLTQSPSWGWRLRQGHLPLSEADAACLRAAMTTAVSSRP